MSTPAFRLLNEFQRGFPLCGAPFEDIAKRLGESETWVLQRLRAWSEQGVVSRIGAVFAPRTIGASVLAALSVSQPKLERVARQVSAHPEVNHNYEREHRYNLWFVVTARSAARVADVLERIEAEADCGRILALPLLDEYRIDLGFDLRPALAGTDGGVAAAKAQAVFLCEAEWRLVAALEPGLPLVVRPYAALSQAAGLAEEEALLLIERWIDQGVIRRFGVILRHRELGYHANAMVVWSVPDSLVTALGLRLAQQPGVTLCYRRQRSLPEWPYNLFCMIHGRGREAVLERVDQLRADCGLADFASRILFGRRRFKQQGARYANPVEIAHG